MSDKDEALFEAWDVEYFSAGKQAHAREAFIAGLTAGRAEVQKRIEDAPRAWFVEYDTGGSMMGHAYKPDTTWDPSYEAPRLVRLVPE